MTHSLPVNSGALLTKDAGNRAWRTFLQALALEIGVQVVPALNAALQDEGHVYNVDWLQSLVRLAGMTALAFFMRKVLDPSGIPTPLPPSPQPQPADQARVSYDKSDERYSEGNDLL